MEDLIIKALIVYGIELVHRDKHTLKAAMAWSLALILLKEAYWKFMYLDSTWQDSVYDNIGTVGWIVGQMFAIVVLVEFIHRIARRLKND